MIYQATGTVSLGSIHNNIVFLLWIYSMSMVGSKSQMSMSYNIKLSFDYDKFCIRSLLKERVDSHSKFIFKIKIQFAICIVKHGLGKSRIISDNSYLIYHLAFLAINYVIM